MTQHGHTPRLSRLHRPDRGRLRGVGPRALAFPPPRLGHCWASSAPSVELYKDPACHLSRRPPLLPPPCGAACAARGWTTRQAPWWAGSRRTWLWAAPSPSGSGGLPTTDHVAQHPMTQRSHTPPAQIRRRPRKQARTPHPAWRRPSLAAHLRAGGVTGTKRRTQTPPLHPPLRAESWVCTGSPCACRTPPRACAVPWQERGRAERCGAPLPPTASAEPAQAGACHAPH